MVSEIYSPCTLPRITREHTHQKEEVNQEKEYTTCRKQRILHRKKAKDQEDSCSAELESSAEGTREEGIQKRGRKNRYRFSDMFTS